jgi:hypothetical protein
MSLNSKLVDTDIQTIIIGDNNNGEQLKMQGETVDGC